jgi:multiple sugar transport system substrate-binding protein
MDTADRHSQRRVDRRELLTRAGAAAGGVAVGSLLGISNADAARVIPRRALSPTEIVVMTEENEFPSFDIDAFQSRQPNIKITLLDYNEAKLAAMFAAGTPPDLIRSQAPGIPQYIARRMIRPLTSYFQASDVLRPGDLASANNYYKWNGRSIGSGDIYGIVKDWSPDFTLFAYTDAFKNAKLEIPSRTRPLRYSQVADIAAKLGAQKRKGRSVYRGFVHSNDLQWIDRTVMNMLAERGKSLYASNFERMNLTKNPDAVRAFRYFYDLHRKNLDINPRNPTSAWGGVEFTAGKIGLIQYGYWFSAMAESKLTKGKVVALPAPTWVGVRRDPTMTATGFVMAQLTKNPDAAWEVFEYYMGGKPARDRAASGWGVPGLKSLYDLMPRKTAFQRQVQKVVQAEIVLDTKPLQFNPYLSEFAVSNAYKKHLAQALSGRMSFDELLRRLERDTNELIKEGKERTG